MLLAVTIVVGLVGGASSYFQGGGRASIDLGRFGAPVAVGEETHFVIPISVDGTIRLRSVDATLDGGGATVSTRLVRLVDGQPAGMITGPLAVDLETVAIAGHRIESPGSGVPELALDVLVTAQSEGVHRVTQVRLEYDAGRFRHHTAAIESPICLAAGEARGTDASACEEDRG